MTDRTTERAPALDRDSDKAEASMEERLDRLEAQATRIEEKIAEVGQILGVRSVVKRRSR